MSKKMYPFFVCHETSHMMSCSTSVSASCQIATYLRCLNYKAILVLVYCDTTVSSSHNSYANNAALHLASYLQIIVTIPKDSTDCHPHCLMPSVSSMSHVHLHVGCPRPSFQETRPPSLFFSNNCDAWRTKLFSFPGHNIVYQPVSPIFMSRSMSAFFAFLIHGNLRMLLTYLSLKSLIFIFSECQMFHDSHITCLCFWIVLVSYAKCKSIYAFLCMK